MSSRSRPLMMADWWMRTMLNDYKIAKCYILNDYKFILNNRIQFYLDFNWKESYENQDKSSEDRANEPKGSNGKGNERLSRYTDLINVSTQLKSLPEYRSSIYYQEPFYQLMRQTLWAENILKNHEVEKLKADDYLHVHVIPKANHDLLNKTYKVSGKTMEETWRSMLSDQSKYVIVDPQDLMKPIFDLYPELTEYLRLRYW